MNVLLRFLAFLIFHRHIFTNGSVCLVETRPCSNASSSAGAGSGAGAGAAWAVVLSAVMVSAVLGNLLVIVSVLRYDRLRRVANSFIVSLAFADLLVAVLVMPFNASQVRRRHRQAPRKLQSDSGPANPSPSLCLTRPSPFPSLPLPPPSP